ncbi:MAG: sigma factor-like helix-turn-helix DNA-binding protein [bacterium]
MNNEELNTNLKNRSRDGACPVSAMSKNFDPLEVVNLLLKNLLKREQEVLKRRFALHGKNRDTLEKIGNDYDITRERVRQIEASGIKKIRAMIKSGGEKLNLPMLEEAMINSLSASGGVRREDIFLEEILALLKKINNELHQKNLLFLITYLMEENDKLLKEAGDNNLEPFWHLNSVEISEIKKSIEKIVDIFLRHGAPLGMEELISKIKKEHNDESELSLQKHLREETEKEKIDKIITSHLDISKVLKQNILNQWGSINWNTVVPKRMNDKIFLVLKREKKPLHFSEIAQRINEMNFDKKSAYPATVHNELILDDKYILVGRGVYALREWGYKDGTVSDVIAAILRENGEPVEKQKIIDEVLSQRMVRPTTVALVLNDKNRFKDMGDERYSLV